MTQLQYTLGECLSEYGLRELPAEWNPDTSTLVDGIALVTKATGKEYCKVANKDGNIAVVKDFGRTSMILRVEKIFAVNTITKADIPKFANDAEILHYLTKSRYDRAKIESLLSTDNKSPEQIEADRNGINRLVRDLSLGSEQRKIAERKRVNEIKEFAEKAKEEKQKSKTNGRRKKKV